MLRSDSLSPLVSVIIPVYNAATYVRQAVESALAQPETAEIILVEDNSSDNSLVVCQELAAQYPRVHLYRHPDGKNHGAAASRNLAIDKSTCEYIAFLDADDFYLPDRFSLAMELFNGDPTIEGVYEALGDYVENENARQRWIKANRPIGNLITMNVSIPSEHLYELLVTWEYGYFHLNCITIRRSVFGRTGPFIERLRLHQDTDMIWKMAAVAKLVPGTLDDPVALRRIHELNRISAPRLPSDICRAWSLLMQEAWSWGCANLKPTQLKVLLLRYIDGEVSFFWRQPELCLQFVDLLCQNLPDSLNHEHFKRVTRGKVRKELGFKRIINGFRWSGYRHVIKGILLAPELFDLSVLAVFAELIVGRGFVNRLRSLRHREIRSAA